MPVDVCGARSNIVMCNEFQRCRNHGAKEIHMINGICWRVTVWCKTVTSIVTNSDWPWPSVILTVIVSVVPAERAPAVVAWTVRAWVPQGF